LRLPEKFTRPKTPGGEAVVAVYRGSYDRLNEAYKAIEKWTVENSRETAGLGWEIYGDPKPKPADTETTVVQLLDKARGGA